MKSIFSGLAILFIAGIYSLDWLFKLMARNFIWLFVILMAVALFFGPAALMDNAVKSPNAATSTEPAASAPAVADNKPSAIEQWLIDHTPKK